MTQTRRAAKKGRLRPTLEVRCESWDEFAALYANDISLGGIYIETDERPDLMSTVEVKILLPEGHEVKFNANVVHVPSAGEAEAEGRAEGVGLEFRNIDPMMKRQLWHLVEYAKWEAGAPDARSYAAALMEFAEAQAEASEDSEAWRSLSPPPFEDEPPEPPAEEEEEPEGGQTEEKQGVEAPSERRTTKPAPPSYEAEAKAVVKSIPGPSAVPSSAVTPPPRRSSTRSGPTERKAAPETPPLSRRPPEPEEAVQSSAPPAPTSQRPARPSGMAASSRPAPAPGSSRPPAAGRSYKPPPSVPEAFSSMRPPTGRATDAARKLAASLRSKKAGGGRPPPPSAAPPSAKRTSLAPGGARSSLAPGGARNSLVPGGARSSKTPSAIRGEKLSVAFKDIAYKRYDLAIRTLEEIMSQEPTNLKARIWLNVARARRAVQKGKSGEAAKFFRLVLELDEQNHEAQKFVQAYERDQRVKSMPFGRYFTKKS